MKKSKIERLHEKHNKDLMSLNRGMIAAMSRPRIQSPIIAQNTAQTKKTLTKKQKKALEQGRKILQLKRQQTTV